MMLAHIYFEKPLSFEKDNVVRLVIKDPKCFGTFAKELYIQSQNRDGRFVMIDDDKARPFNREAEVIFNPFSLELNSRNNMSGLISRMALSVNSPDNHSETMELLHAVQKYLLNLLEDEDLSASSSGDLDFSAFLKSTDIGFTTEDSSESALVDYVRITNLYSGIKLFVFINLSSYLSNDQLSTVIQDFRHLPVSVLLLEKDTSELDVKTKIIDEDYCEIEGNTPCRKVFEV